MEPRCLITVWGRQCEHYRSRVTLRCRVRPCVGTWVDWWHSVCLNAQRIKPSCLPRNSGGLRSSGRYACFVRELRDYCDLTSAQQLRQLSDIRRDPVRLVLLESNLAAECRPGLSSK